MKKVYYYNTYEDDIVKNANQNYELKSNFKWVHSNLIYKIIAKLLKLLITLWSLIYDKLYLHVSIKNKKILKKEKGYFLYSNHTQMLGDVFNPFLICFPHHPNIICSASNLGIPILGKLLAMGGAIPIPNNVHDMMKFKEKINDCIKKNQPIIIYPEAHLWPYATFIRPYSNVSFHYPVQLEKKVFVATTTYVKSKLFKKPKIIIYIDGPFQSNCDLSRKENIKNMHDLVYNTMQKRSQLNNYEYVTYKKKD